MHKRTTRFMIALLTFLLGVSAAAAFLLGGKDTSSYKEGVKSSSQTKRSPRLAIPRGEWESFFFSSLNKLTEQANLQSLRTVALPDDDFEVRIWYDGRPYTINGVVLRHTAGEWSAVRVHGRFFQQHIRARQEPLSVPKSGWELTWRRLVKAGILTLPDASEAQCRSGALDGGSYVVEININETYRTYAYSNPQLMQCNEAKQIIDIEEIISDEFDLESSPY